MKKKKARERQEEIVESEKIDQVNRMKTGMSRLPVDSFLVWRDTLVCLDLWREEEFLLRWLSQDASGGAKILGYKASVRSALLLLLYFDVSYDLHKEKRKNSLGERGDRLLPTRLLCWQVSEADARDDGDVEGVRSRRKTEKKHSKEEKRRKEWEKKMKED